MSGSESRRSNFTDAHSEIQEPRMCRKCGAMDLPAAFGAKPTLEREQDGSYTCTCCSFHFTLARPPEPSGTGR